MIKLTDHARNQIAGIYNYSLQNFGQKIAENYILDIRSRLDDLADDFSIGTIRTDMSSRYRFISVRSHYIIYEIIGSIVFVVTIEHQRRDIPVLLADMESLFEKQIKKLSRTLT